MALSVFQKRKEIERETFSMLEANGRPEEIRKSKMKLINVYSFFLFFFYDFSFRLIQRVNEISFN